MEIFAMLSYLICFFLNVTIAIYACKMYKLLNHGNYWWVICSGFAIIAIKSIMSIFFLVIVPNEMKVSTLFIIGNIILPLFAGLTIMFGMKRMYNAAQETVNSEHYAKRRLSYLKRIQKRMDKYETRKIAEVLINNDINRRSPA